MQSQKLLQLSSSLLVAQSSNVDQDGMMVDVGIEYHALSNLTQDPSKPRQDLPVGLENIGNTCYLNSILQLLFSIKPTRDITMNYDQYRLGLDNESVANRRIGGNKMVLERAEAVVAQIC